MSKSEGDHVETYREAASSCSAILRFKKGAASQKPIRRNAIAVPWVKPELVAEVTFQTSTSDGLLRHVVFQGLRDDKMATPVGPPMRFLPISLIGPAKQTASQAGVFLKWLKSGCQEFISSPTLRAGDESRHSMGGYP